MPILNETIRNLYFHVTMWMAMLVLMICNAFYGIIYLNKSDLYFDLVAEECGRMAMIFGVSGLITGMVWANYTWGAPWVNDPQLNGTAASLLVYAAYFILRNAIPDDAKRARLAAVYGIFAFVMMIVFIMVLPKMTDSLHPGKGGAIARGAGTYAQLNARDGRFAIIKLPSGETRMILTTCIATIGAVSNGEHALVVSGKAGRSRWLGRRPRVRGVVMNPVDHPHGGGEGKTGEGRVPVSPWGTPTKGYRTRRNKRTNSMILKRRHKR